jgi:hypothetical protein
MSDVKKLLRGIRKITKSDSFENSKYSEVKEWISTGDYGLNRIISGSIYKGIPAGRVVLIGGESQSGKSFLAAQVAANAQKDLGYDLIFYFDSEGGAMKEFFSNRGCDINKIEQVLVESVEDSIIKILSTYKQIEAYKEENPNFKCLFILDSLGALTAGKFIDDAAKGKVAQDMGARAKLCACPDTPVYMADGTYKRLGDVLINDEVVTHKGTIEKVIDKFPVHHEQFVKINANGETIKVSLNHKMLVQRDDNLLFMEAKDIKTTDKLVHRKIMINNYVDNPIGDYL